MAVVRDTQKTGFVKAVLAKNNAAKAEDVNKAWKEAGHTDSISDSLVSKTRSALKLTRKKRSSRLAEGAGAKTGATKALAKRTVDATPPAASPAPRSRGAHAGRAQVLQELESVIDQLIFQSLAIGGLDEFEDALRKARRILVRSHGD